jgi:hypothetical protein
LECLFGKFSEAVFKGDQLFDPSPLEHGALLFPNRMEALTHTQSEIFARQWNWPRPNPDLEQVLHDGGFARSVLGPKVKAARGPCSGYTAGIPRAF